MVVVYVQQEQNDLLCEYIMFYGFVRNEGCVLVTPCIREVYPGSTVH